MGGWDVVVNGRERRPSNGTEQGSVVIPFFLKYTRGSRGTDLCTADQQMNTPHSASGTTEAAAPFVCSQAE